MAYPARHPTRCRAAGRGKLATFLALTSLALCASTLTGCGTLVPETRIKPIAPASANAGLPAAVAFADEVATEFDDLQSQISYSEAGLGWGTLALAAVVGYDVMFSRAIATVRAPVLGLAFLQGAETTTGVRSKRDILDAGSTALACAKRVAYTMDALPAAVGNEAASSVARNPSPMAEFARTARPQAAPLAPSASRSASARAQAVVEVLRAAPKPGPTVAGAAAPTDRIADAIASSVAGMDKANANAAAAADKSKLLAPQYLSSTVELVARQVLTQLHAATPSLDAIVTTVRTQSRAYLSTAQDALGDSATSTAVMATSLDAAKPVMAQVVQLTGQLKVAEAAATPASEDTSNGVATSRRRAPRADVRSAPSRAVVDAVEQAKAATATAVQQVTQVTEGAAAQAQATQSTAVTVKQLLDFAAACDK